jgi:hypothetical protein
MQPIGFVQTDSGRALSHPDEKNDCTVRAFAAFARERVTYAQAHEIFTKAGRKPRHGCRVAEKVMTEQGYPLTWLCQNMSLNRFIKENPTGRFYMLVRGHAFVLENGKILDTFVTGGKRQILAYVKWRG